MGWHRISETEVCGDDPVQILSQAIEHLILLWAFHWDKKPTQQELNTAWNSALIGHSNHVDQNYFHCFYCDRKLGPGRYIGEKNGKFFCEECWKKVPNFSPPLFKKRSEQKPTKGNDE